MTKTEYISARLTPGQAEKLQRLAERIDAPKGRIVGWLIDQAGEIPTPAFYATNPAAKVSEAQTAGFAQSNP